MITTTGKSIQAAAAILHDEGVVGIPTETVYGLAANALSKKAVAKIFAVKQRPSFDPLIIHTDDLSKVNDLVRSIPPALQELAAVLMPGPITLLLEKTTLIPDITTSGLPKVAVRIPKHTMARELLAAVDFPLAAPSANPFGYVSPTTATHVADQLGGLIPYILDGGRCAVGLESTIVDYQENKVVILRKGGTPVTTIEDIVGPVKVLSTSSSKPSAPGMLSSHYSPTVPLQLCSVTSALSRYDTDRIGHIAWSQPHPELPLANQLLLTKSDSMLEAAYNLFSHLRELDGMDLDIIVTELVPDQGLGSAINDKLRRAAAK